VAFGSGIRSGGCESADGPIELPADATNVTVLTGDEPSSVRLGVFGPGVPIGELAANGGDAFDLPRLDGARWTVRAAGGARVCTHRADL
jgi:hypothetical protein